MKSKKWKVIIGMVLILVMSITGCGNGDSKNEVNIGYFNNITHSQALWMKSQGTLEESLGEEINLKWTAFNAGPAEVEALFSGDVDMGYIGPVPAVSANVKSNGDVVVLTGATQGGEVLVARADAGIESVADLSGKVVAIPQIGNTQHISLLQLLSSNGLKPVTEGGNVTVTAVANADVGNMLDRGDIDAALVPEPWGATLMEKGAKLVLGSEDIYMNGEYNTAVVVVRKEFLEKNPEIVEKFLEAHGMATDAINNNRDEALKTINEELKNATGKQLGDDIIKSAFERIVVTDQLNKESVLGFAQLSLEQEFIKEIPEEANLFTE
ncbi:MAG: aliphatic sulfonate ABC transporter substrate-binding protein [Lachnospiraceae bacterium]|nr:aliphatic sulfonate ABC transporter substrate-binding protein [Lachnospiraceae bacterium]